MLHNKREYLVLKQIWNSMRKHQVYSECLCNWYSVTSIWIVPESSVMSLVMEPLHCLLSLKSFRRLAQWSEPVPSESLWTGGFRCTFGSKEASEYVMQLISWGAEQANKNTLQRTVWHTYLWQDCVFPFFQFCWPAFSIPLFLDLSLNLVWCLQKILYP